MPVGIEPRFLRSTIYLYPSEEAAKDGAPIGGSGFVLGITALDGKAIARYAVTNKHVVDTGNRVIRTNTPTGMIRIVRTQPDDWIVADDDDLAVADFDGPAEGCIVMDEAFLEENCQIDDWPILQGDDVFLFGRFVTHEGIQRNKPVLRFGNISMMPDEETPIRMGTHEQLAFLVECRSLSGFSGSPAFVRLTQPRLTSQRGWIPSKLRFLGVDCGHLPHWSRARERPHGNAPLLPDTWVETNSGMAVIIPAWRLKALMNREDLLKARARALKAFQDRQHGAGEAIADMVPGDGDAALGKDF